MEPRTYCIGVPVAITVSDDGTVSYSVDLAEADQLWEDPDSTENLPEDVVNADALRVAADVAQRPFSSLRSS